MLEKVIELLLALLVGTGAAGVGTAAEHAAPGASEAAADAIAAIIARVSDATEVVAAEARGLERAADHVTNDHALGALEDAAVAREAGLATADEARAQAPAGQPGALPPVEAPPVGGPPADHPPVPAPPVELPQRP